MNLMSREKELFPILYELMKQRSVLFFLQDFGEFLLGEQLDIHYKQKVDGFNEVRAKELSNLEWVAKDIEHSVHRLLEEHKDDY